MLRIRIRDLVPFWQLDPGWVKSPRSGFRIWDEHPGSYSTSLETIFFVNKTKFSDADPEFFWPWIRVGKIRIRDPGLTSWICNTAWNLYLLNKIPVFIQLESVADPYQSRFKAIFRVLWIRDILVWIQLRGSGGKKEKAHLYVNSTTQRCPKEIMGTFLIEDFFHLPPVSTTPMVHLKPWISPLIFEKIWNDPKGILRCLGEIGS